MNEPPPAPAFTALQGQYLAFIRTYALIQRRPPSETEIQVFFRVTAPSVHRMMGSSLHQEVRTWSPVLSRPRIKVGFEPWHSFSLGTGARGSWNEVRIDEIHAATEAPTLIEEYPEDEPYPSRLVLGWAGGRPLHIVLAGPTIAGDTVVVTLYEPEVERWEPGFVRRKPKP